MLLANANQVVGLRAIDIDLVIVRTDSKHGSTRRVLHSFNPFLRIILCDYDFIDLVDASTNSQSTIIMADSYVTI